MHFQTPAWFLALGALPALLIFLLWSDKRQQRSWQNFVAPKLRAKLVKLSANRRRWLVRSLLLAAAALSILALARPQWGSETRENAVSGRQVLVAMDISRSMLTQDVQPSRLDFARVAALELIDALPDERIGLAAFASDAFLLSPLTIDHDAIRESVAALDPELTPRKGSKLNQALELALRTYRRSAAESKLLVIFSDGEAHIRLDSALVEQIADQGILVVCLGIGSDEGGTVLVSSSDKSPFTDKDGRIIRSSYEGQQLEELATSTQGIHTRLAPGQSAVPTIMQALRTIESSPAKSRFREVPIERFHWFLGPALILCILAALLANNHTKRSPKAAVTAASLLIFFFSPQQAKADLFGRAENQAIEAFSRGRMLLDSDPESSQKLFTQALLSPNTQHQQAAHINLAHLQLAKASHALFHRDGAGKVAPSLPAESIRRLIQDADSHLARAQTVSTGQEDSIARHIKWSQQLKTALQEYPKTTQSTSGKPNKPDPKTSQEPDQNESNNSEQNSGTSNSSSPKSNSENNAATTQETDQKKSTKQPDLTPRPGETPEEQARRILRAHSDLRGPQKRKPHPLGTKPDKDW